MAAAEPKSAPDDPAALREAIRERALSDGFDAIGFTHAGLGAEPGRRLGDYLARGFHGDMGWLAERAAQRASPDALWPAARTAIALAVNYGPDYDPLTRLADPGLGNISVYAQGKDYHAVVKKRLKALGGWIHRTWGIELKVFVDTAPVMEKPVAQRAGLGWQGKHSNLVSPRFGSWVFLGEILLAAELPPDEPGGDRCGSCRRCLDICPTGAFPAPYRLDARRCISYLTIEHKGHIPESLRPLMGNRIYGCDDCLAVCPWNKFAKVGRESALMPRDELTGARLAALARLDDAAFRAMFAGTAIKRTGRDRFVRNVLIAIGNSADTGLIPDAARLRADASPLVREAARWATDRLSGDAGLSNGGNDADDRAGHAGGEHAG